MLTRYETMTRPGALDSYRNFVGNDQEYRSWYNVIGQHRDSDALARSNFRVALKMLGGESDTVMVARYGHWAVGWIEEVYVAPGSAAQEIGEGIEHALADYPVLDEEDFSNEEMEEALQVWSECYNTKERLTYIREHRSQFDFCDIAHMLDVARGRDFNGYACELIN